MSETSTLTPRHEIPLPDASEGGLELEVVTAAGPGGNPIVRSATLTIPIELLGHAPPLLRAREAGIPLVLSLGNPATSARTVLEVEEVEETPTHLRVGYRRREAPETRVRTDGHVTDNSRRSFRTRPPVGAVVPATVRLHPRPGRSGAAVLEGRVTDLSVEGVGLFLRREELDEAGFEAEPGLELAVTLRLPDVPAPLTVTARIRRLTRTDRGLIVGAAFPVDGNLAAGPEQEAVARCVMEWQRLRLRQERR